MYTKLDDLNNNLKEKLFKDYKIKTDKYFIDESKNTTRSKGA